MSGDDKGDVEQGVSGWPFAVVMGVSLLAHLGFFALLHHTPPAHFDLSIDLLEGNNRWVDIMIPPRDPEPEGEPEVPRPPGDGSIAFRTSSIFVVPPAEVWWVAPVDSYGIYDMDPEYALQELTSPLIFWSFGYNGLKIRGINRGASRRDPDIARRRAQNVHRYREAFEVPIMRAKVEIGEPDVRGGGLPEAVIRRVVARHRNEMKYCYEQQLARNPGLAGEIVVKMVVHSAGRVQGAAVSKSTTGDSRVDHCIAGVARRLTFPQPRDNKLVIVELPMRLSAKI